MTGSAILVLDRIVRSRPTRRTGRMASLATVAGLAIWTFLAAPAAFAAAPIDPPKKVGTERILIDPKPMGPDVAPPAPATPPAAATAPSGGAGETGVEAHKGEEGLPPAVARMRRRLLDAAYSGDLGRLRIAIQSNEMPPVFSVNEIGDPIEYLKSQSGDGQGLELLAILTDVLEGGWVRIKPGTPQEMYVWPAFAAMPIDHLRNDQLVELYKIVTSSDFEEMKGAGRYTFYTVGIGPDGTWHWFKLAD